MTVAVAQTRVSYNGNGVTTVFNYGYKFFDSADLLVYVVEIADTSNFELLELGADYSVTGAGAPTGGDVTLSVAPATGFKVVIINDPAAVQPVHYEEGDAFPAASHEAALDRLTKLIQRIQDRMARTVQISDVSDAVLPDPDDFVNSANEAIAAAAEAAGSAASAAASVTAAAASATTATTQATAAAASAAAADASADETDADRIAAAASAAAAAAAQAAAALSATAADTSADAADASEAAAAASQAAAASSALAASADAGDADAARIAAETARDQAQNAAESMVNGVTLIGDWDASSGVFPGTGSAEKGWMWKVSVGGTVNGIVFGTDDTLIAKVDNASINTYANNWIRIEGGTITSSQVTTALGFTPPPNTRTVTGSGLVTGGGDLSANRVLAVAAAVLADLISGSSDVTKALTPKAFMDFFAAMAGNGLTISAEKIGINTNNAMGIGSYSMLYNNSISSISFNEIVDGSNLSGCRINSSGVFVSVAASSPTGTWRSMMPTSIVANGFGLFMRVT